MTTLICDIEANGFNPNEIFVLGIIDYETEEFTAYTGDSIPEGLMRLNEAEVVIGHNFKGYDARQIRKLTEGLVPIPDTMIIDTLEMSRKLFPNRKSHKLGDWGEFLGYPKIEFNDFSKFDPKMVPYCEMDCIITLKLFHYLAERTNK